MRFHMLSIAVLLAACAYGAQHSLPQDENVDDFWLLDDALETKNRDLEDYGTVIDGFIDGPRALDSSALDSSQSYSYSYGTVPVTDSPPPPPPPPGGKAPVASPTMSPTLSYNEIVAVNVAFSMTGLTCADYGTDEKATMTTALATTLSVDESAIGGHTCDDVSRRRHLLSTSVSLGFTITIVSNSGGALDTASTLTSALETAAGDNTLINAIVSASGSSVFASIPITISDLSTTTVNLTPTASPVAAPKPPPAPPAPPAPTVTPATKITSGAGAVKPALVTLVCASTAWALGSHW